jgi:YVTN family beta-propeller protein
MNDNTATIIDAATGNVSATLPTGEGPHEVAISHDGAIAVVSNYGVRGKPGNSLTVIDVARRTVLRTLTLTGYQRPHGMAFLPGDTIIAVTAEMSRAVLLVDIRTGDVRRTLGTNGRSTHMIGLSADGRRAVTSNIADNTISVLQVDGNDSATVIHVAAQPEGIAISPDGAHAWAGSNRDSVVVVVDLKRAAVVDTLRGFGLAYRMAFTPDGKTVVVTDPVKAVVRIFDAASHRELRTVAFEREGIVPTAEIPGSPSPEGVAISRDSRWAYITLQGRNRVATVEIATGAIVSLAPTGTWSDGVGYSPVVAR